MTRGRLATNVLATFALVLGLSAGSYGALNLPRNSVRSEHIVNGQVKTRDLARNAVTANKVANRAIGRNKFSLGRLPIGLPGSTGAGGDKGETGDRGPRGAAALHFRLAAQTIIPPGSGPTQLAMTPEPTWTQEAGETDVVAMRVRLEQVAGGGCGGSNFVIVSATAGTNVLGSAVSSLGAEGDFATVLGGIPGPDSAQSRTITVSATSLCSDGDFLVEAVDIRLLRVP